MKNFWEKGNYYQNKQGIFLSSTLDGEVFDQALYCPPDTYHVCESEEILFAESAFYARRCIVLKFSDPRVSSVFIRHRFLANYGADGRCDYSNGYRKIENELLIIALATTGLI